MLLTRLRSALGAAVLLLSVNLSAAVPSLADLARHPAHMDAKIAPDGSHLAVRINGADGHHELAVFDLRKQMEPTARVRFPPPSQVGDFTWANDDRLVIDVQRHFGANDYASRTGELFAVNEDGTYEEMIFGYRAGWDQTGSWTRSKDMEFRGYYDLIHVLPDDPKRILIARHHFQLDGDIPEVEKLDIYTGRTSRVTRGPGRNAAFVTDAEGNLTVSVLQSDDLHLEVYRRTEDGWDQVVRRRYGSGQIVPMTMRDEHRLWVQDGTEPGPRALASLDLRDGTLKRVFSNPVADVHALSWRGMAYGVRTWPDHPQQYPLRSGGALADALAVATEAFPGQYVRLSSFTTDQRQAVIEVGSATNPGAFYLYDAEAGTLQFLVHARPRLADATLAETRPISLQARDGLTLHGYLTPPLGGKEDAAPPLVVLPHGGPHGPRDYNLFDPEVQALATRGYAVLQVNFRGSGGYGDDFEAAGHGEWGAKMQDDLTDATRWVIAQGHGDPARTCIMGASYGGYAALQGLVREPDLYACGVGFVGVYDLALMFDRGDVQLRNSGINYLKEVLGEDDDLLRARSPAHNAQRIKAPVLLVHGRRDERVPIAHGRRMRDALEDAGVPVEWFVKDSEAHGFYDVDNRREYFERVLGFLDRHIGGQAVATR